MAPLNRDDVAKVAQLALLNLDDDEIDRFTGQLAAVLDRAAELEAFDIADVPRTAHPYPLVNVFRADVAEESDDVRAEALAAAPEAEDGQYRVPPALGEEP
ncbi:MAG: Asp-tRNA(Asn)/Glu-tRNA(Gln) amidotransferase subunit GatC [Actinomycetota bacterium]